MSEFRPSCYRIAPDGAKAGPMMLRRFYVAALIEGDEYPALHTLSKHVATYAAAERRLPQCREEWPNAQISSVLLTFNPKDPAQVEAFERLSAEDGVEPWERQP